MDCSRPVGIAFSLLASTTETAALSRVQRQPLVYVTEFHFIANEIRSQVIVIVRLALTLLLRLPENAIKRFAIKSLAHQNRRINWMVIAVGTNGAVKRNGKNRFLTAHLSLAFALSWNRQVKIEIIGEIRLGEPSIRSTLVYCNQTIMLRSIGGVQNSCIARTK